MAEGLSTIHIKYLRTLTTDGSVSLTTPAIFLRIPATVACSQIDDTQVLVLLPTNNYMGALPQDNTPSPSWTEFFIHRRLEPQIRLALSTNLLDNTA